MGSGSLKEALGRVAVSPYDELVAYEYLRSGQNGTFKSVTQATVGRGMLPTEALCSAYGTFLPDDYRDVENYLDSKIGAFSVVVNNTPSWPAKLKDSERPTPILYYRGNVGYLELPSVSVVGARKASQEGLARARKIARELVAHDICVVTGLAKGIDTAATQGALESGGRTIAVIGTPINECYPRENAKLQDFLAERHLVVSQVPLYKYSIQPFKSKKQYFPERNELMAAVSDATVIVEASDTSGTLTQARACLHQKRPLFIMRSCVENPAVSWPGKYVGKPGVYVLDSVEQVIDAIGR